MRAWVRQLRPSALGGLWYVLGVLIYHFIRRQPPPTWRELPDYLATYTGFVLASATVIWWRRRRKTNSPPPQQP